MRKMIWMIGAGRASPGESWKPAAVCALMIAPVQAQELNHVPTFRMPEASPTDNVGPQAPQQPKPRQKPTYDVVHTADWTFTNNTPWTIQLSFETSDGSKAWPGDGRAYVLPAEAQSFRGLRPIGGRRFHCRRLPTKRRT